MKTAFWFPFVFCCKRSSAEESTGVPKGEPHGDAPVERPPNPGLDTGLQVAGGEARFPSRRILFRGLGERGLLASTSSLRTDQAALWTVEWALNCCTWLS